MKIAVIVNEASGRAGELDADVRASLGDDALWLALGGDDDVDVLVREALGRGCTRIVAAGGDGTVHEAANAILGSGADAELAVLPLGTGNDLARALHIPLKDLRAAATHARTAAARPADVVRVSTNDGPWDRFMLNAGYGGMGGPVAHAVEPEAKERWGAAAYWFTAVQRALDLPVHRLEVDADGVAFAIEAHGVLVANGCFLGGGIPVAPGARLDDGRFDVLILPAQSAMATLAEITRIVRAQHQEQGQALAFTARSLRCTADPAMAFTIDGEVGPNDSLQFELIPSAIRLVADDGAVAFSARPAAPFETPDQPS